MKNKFLEDVSNILENKKPSSIKILLEKKKKKFPEDPFEEKEDKDSELDDSEEGEDSELDDSEEGEGLGLDDSEEGEDSELDDSGAGTGEESSIKQQAAIDAVTTSKRISTEREIKKSQLELENPLNSLLEKKKYNISRFLIETSEETKNDFSNIIDNFLEDNEEKIQKFKVGVEREKKGYGINVEEEVSKAISSLNSFDKKISPPDLVRFTHMQRIIDYSDIEKIDQNMELFDDLYYKEVKELPKYSDYERDDINISLKNHYNSAVVGKSSSG